MKKDVYFNVLIVLQIIMGLLFFYDFTYGILFSGLVVFYELFYVMVVYNSNDRKYLKILTFLIVLSFLIYELISKDSSNLVVLLFTFFNSLFIFSYFKENNINKRLVIDTLRYMYPFVCILFFIIGFYSEVGYFLVLIYPLLFINLNKSKADVALIYLCTIALLLFRENIFTYGVMSYLTVLTLYYSFNRSKKNLEVILPLLVITILVSVSMEGSILSNINSRIFENELLIIKFIKAFIGLFPLMYYASFYMLKVREKKYKTSNDIFIVLLSIFGYFVLILYTRLDIPCILITVNSLLFVTLYKLQCNVDKKLTNDVFVLVDELDNNRVNMIKEISKDTKVLCCYDKEVKNSLDVNYIVNKKPKKGSKTSIKEWFISLVNLYKSKSVPVESLYDNNSKYLIAFTNKYGELISEYGDDDTVKIVIFDDKEDDEEHVLHVSRVFKYVDYILFNTKKMEELYSRKVKAKCMLFDKEDKKLLNNLIK